MHTQFPLQPTLWRTCRVLANRTRLEIFGLLLGQPGQTVTEVARNLRRPLSSTCESLRALEARGLLTVQRNGRRVTYRPSSVTKPSPTSNLVAALRVTFEHRADPVETIFKLATAFTHPRRIMVFRALQDGSRTVLELRAATQISGWALLRHLKKLEHRGYVRHQAAQYHLVPRPDALGRELARMARE